MKSLVIPKHNADNGTEIIDQWYQHHLTFTKSRIQLYIYNKSNTALSLDIFALAEHLGRWPVTGGQVDGAGVILYGYVGFKIKYQASTLYLYFTPADSFSSLTQEQFLIKDLDFVDTVTPI